MLFGWQYFVATPQMKADQARQAVLAQQEKKQPQLGAPGAAPATCRAWRGAAAHMTREAALKVGGARVAIDTPMLDGSIALKGAKLDDLRLKKYRETTDPKSPEIVLLAPKSTDYPYYAQFGWIGAAMHARPTRRVWTQTGQRHAVARPSGDADLGQWPGPYLHPRHRRRRHNTCSASPTASPTNPARRRRFIPSPMSRAKACPRKQTSWVLHQGFVGVANGSEIDANYDDFKEAGTPPKTFLLDRRLGRHHRQILDGGGHPAPGRNL